MVSLPSTPDSNAPSMTVSDEDDLPPILDGTFYIVNKDQEQMTLHFDRRTSVGWALRQAMGNPRWAKYSLRKGLHVLKDLSVKIFDFFDGCEEDQRTLSLIKCRNGVDAHSRE